MYKHPFRIDNVNTLRHAFCMDIEFVRHGIRFVANRNKAQNNLRKHDVSFEQAAEVFFDPFLKMIDASRRDEARDAIIGCDDTERLLFVVHPLDFGPRSDP